MPSRVISGMQVKRHFKGGNISICYTHEKLFKTVTIREETKTYKVSAHTKDVLLLDTHQTPHFI